MKVGQRVDKGRLTVVMIALIAVAGVLITIYILQRDEYISSGEATEIALEHANVGHEPRGLTVTLREDPPRWTKTSATWGVYSRRPYVDYMIDAETGEFSWLGVRASNFSS